jgi:uncharacterized RDD family membrane protein YckC
VRCPRCQRESKDGSVFCPGCGAPLALKPERSARPLDASISLDRRGGVREPTPRGAPWPDGAGFASEPSSAPAAGPTPHPYSPLGPLPDLDRSSWNLGTPVPSREPLFAPLPPVSSAPEPTELDEPAEPAEPVDDTLPDVEVDALEIHLRRPPTWRRVGAWAIDALPFLALLAWAVQAVFGGMAIAKGGPSPDAWRYVELALADAGAITIPLLAGVGILAFVYQTLSHALAGATLGKWILRLRVVGPDGRRPTLRRSAARAVLAAASGLLLGAGLLMALFTESGRGLHDLSAGTWVVEAP